MDGVIDKIEGRGNRLLRVLASRADILLDLGSKRGTDQH